MPTTPLAAHAAMPLPFRHAARIARCLIVLALLADVSGCIDQGPDRTPSKVTITAPPATTMASGTSITLTASVTNSGGKVLTGNTIQWTSSDATIASVTAAGVVTGVRAGDAQITATVGTVQSLPLTLTVTPGVATQLAVRTQPAGAQTGLPLTTQPVIEIHDAAGNLVTSSTVTVTAIIATGGGTITGSTATAAGGVATFTSLAISGLIGDRTLEFSVGGLTSVTSIGFAVAPGPASTLVVRTQPAGAQSGAPMTTQPVIELRDDEGNVTTSTATVTVTIASGGGTVSGATVAAVGGVATFTNLTLSGPVGTHTLAFNSDGLTSVSSSPFMLNVGAASALRVRTQPGGASLGSPLSTQPVIEIVDAGGNVVPQDGVVVTASASSGGSFSGSTATSAAGVATFTGLSIAGSIGSYTATFTASGLASVTSDAFQLGAGPATHLALLSQPNTAQNGVPVTPAPVIAALDEFGNIANYNGTVTANIASGGGSLAFASANIVNGTGVMSLLTITGPIGTVTLSFRSGTFQPVTSVPISLTAGPAMRLVVTTPPPSLVSNGVAMSPQPVVQVQDAGGNVVNSSVTITLVTDAVSGTITNGSATAVNGVATFSGLTLSGPVGARDYQFTAPGLPFSGTFRITIQ